MRYIKKAIKYSWAIPLIFASILFTDICHAQMAPPYKRVVIDTVIVTGTQFLSPDLIAINTNILPGEKIDIERGFFFQAEDGIRGFHVTGVQTCALPI